jgi:flagellar hook-associated protein 2
MPISFSGLATGIDTEALVEQLINVEKQGARTLEARKQNASRRKSIVADLVTKLQALKAAGAALNTPAEVRALKATSSDENKVKVTSSGAAQPAQLALRVSSLARAQTNVSTLMPSADGQVPLVPGAGQLGITVGSGTQVAIDFDSTDTLATVAQRINDEVDGVHAEVINTGAGFQLAISSDESGSAHALSFDEAGTSLGFLQPTSLKVEASDAVFTLNGIEMTRSSNTVGDAISGLTFSLVDTHEAADPDTMIGVTTDPAGLEEKVKGLVDSFNALAELVTAQTTYTGVTRGQDTLFGDSTVRALQRSMSELATGSHPHGEGTVSLGQFGISLGRDGRLSIDSAKLATAVGDDPQAIENLLAGPDSLTAAIDDMVSSYTAAGEGYLTAKTTSLTNEMRNYDVGIERIETRAERVGEQLRAQFTALEQLMSNFQSQQAALVSLLG